MQRFARRRGVVYLTIVAFLVVTSTSMVGCGGGSGAPNTAQKPGEDDGPGSLPVTGTLALQDIECEVPVPLGLMSLQGTGLSAENAWVVFEGPVGAEKTRRVMTMGLPWGDGEFIAGVPVVEPGVWSVWVEHWDPAATDGNGVPLSWRFATNDNMPTVAVQRHIIARSNSVQFNVEEPPAVTEADLAQLFDTVFEKLDGTLDEIEEVYGNIEPPVDTAQVPSTYTRAGYEGIGIGIEAGRSAVAFAQLTDLPPPTGGNPYEAEMRFRMTCGAHYVLSQSMSELDLALSSAKRKAYSDAADHAGTIAKICLVGAGVTFCIPGCQGAVPLFLSAFGAAGGVSGASSLLAMFEVEFLNFVNVAQTIHIMEGDTFRPTNVEGTWSTGLSSLEASQLTVGQLQGFAEKLADEKLKAYLKAKKLPTPAQLAEACAFYLTGKLLEKMIEHKANPNFPLDDHVTARIEPPDLVQLEPSGPTGGCVIRPGTWQYYPGVTAMSLPTEVSSQTASFRMSYLFGQSDTSTAFDLVVYSYPELSDLPETPVAQEKLYDVWELVDPYHRGGGVGTPGFGTWRIGGLSWTNAEPDWFNVMPAADHVWLGVRDGKCGTYGLEVVLENMQISSYADDTLVRNSVHYVSLPVTGTRVTVR